MITIEGNARAPGRGRLVAAIALVAAVATLSLSLSPGTAVAARDGQARTADVTFTKWVVTLPTDPSTLAGIQMAGVVGGDVGVGRYAGQVISDDTTSVPGFWLAHVHYGFHGRKHTFVADLRITEDDRTPAVTATIRGVVSSGWLKGARVTGEYVQHDSCPIPTPGNVFGTLCFEGALHLRLGGES